MTIEIRASQTASEPSSLRLVSTLTFAGFLSGLIIVGMFEATMPTINANKAKVLREAVFKVLPGTVRMQRMVYGNDRLTVSEAGEDRDAVFAGFDANDRLVGYAIPGQGPGFQDIISLLYGYRAGDRKVIGMEILDSRETPGLGDKIYKDAAFVANFDNLAVDPEIVAVKKGKKAAPNQIDAITGATISSKAVVRIINQANSRWGSRLAPQDAAPRDVVAKRIGGAP